MAPPAPDAPRNLGFKLMIAGGVGLVLGVGSCFGGIAVLNGGLGSMATALFYVGVTALVVSPILLVVGIIVAIVQRRRA